MLKLCELKCAPSVHAARRQHAKVGSEDLLFKADIVVVGDTWLGRPLDKVMVDVAVVGGRR